MSIRRCGSQHFAAYNRFHNHHCHGGNFGSVFNITNKCSGGHTNFIGGFGAGLGFGLANLLGGFLGGGFNFGGFGMGGFGFPSFGMGGFGGFGGGFGFPSFGMGGFGGFGGGFGDWSMPWSSTSSSSSSKKSSSCGSGCKCKSTPDTKEDKDVAELNKLRGKYDQLKGNTNLTQPEIDALRKEVEEYGGTDKDGDTDGININDNKTQRQQLLDDINKLNPATNPPVQPLVNNGGQNTVPKTWDDFEKSGNEVGDLSQDQVLEIVKNMKDANGEIKIGKAESAKLELLNNAGIGVYYAKNDGPEVQETYVWGDVKVKLTDDNKLEFYEIDNSTVSGDMGLTWTFIPTKDDKKFTIQKITNTSGSVKYIAPDFKTREFEFNGNVIAINMLPTVSTWERPGYIKLEPNETL